MDHDNVQGSLVASKLAKKYNVIVLRGVEITSKDGHILAYGVEENIPPKLSAEETLDLIRRESLDNTITYEIFDAVPEDLEALQQLEVAAGLVRSLPFDVHLRRVENGYHRLLKTIYPTMRERAARGDESARRWIELFTNLGRTLRFAV